MAVKNVVFNIQAKTGQAVAGMKKVGAATKQANAQVKATTASVGALGAAMKQAAVYFGAFFAVTQVISFGKAIVNTFSDFNASLANLKALTGSTDIALKVLEEDAKRIGRETQFSAQQVVELQTAYAKLGFVPAEILKITDATAQLAAATGEDLVTSAEVAGATLRGFGMEGEEMQRVVDTMANSFSQSALDLSKFSNSMTYVAPVAKQAGFSIEETTAVLAELANIGIDGSMAGTALRSVLLNLSDSSSDLAKKLGGPIKSFKEFVPALQKMKDEGIDLEETLGIIDKRAVTAFSNLIAAGDKLSVVADNFSKTGSAAEMAGIQMDTLKGRTLIMQSVTEGFLIDLGEGLEPAINSVVVALTWFIQQLSLGVNWLKENTGVVKLFVAILVMLNTTLLATAARFIVVNTLGRLWLVLTKLQLVVLKAWRFAMILANVAMGGYAAGTTRAAAAQSILNKAMRANPIGFLIGSVVLLIVYWEDLLRLWGKSEKELTLLAKKQKIYSDLTEKFNKVVGEETGVVMSLFEALKRTNEGSEDRARLIKQINNEYGSYLPNLLTEKSTLEEIEKAQARVNREIVRGIAIKQRESSIAEEIETNTSALLKFSKMSLEIFKKAKKDQGDIPVEPLFDLSTLSTDDIQNYLEVNMLNARQQHTTNLDDIRVMTKEEEAAIYKGQIAIAEAFKNVEYTPEQIEAIFPRDKILKAVEELGGQVNDATYGKVNYAQVWKLQHSEVMKIAAQIAKAEQGQITELFDFFESLIPKMEEGGTIVTTTSIKIGKAITSIMGKFKNLENTRLKIQIDGSELENLALAIETITKNKGFKAKIDAILELDEEESLKRLKMGQVLAEKSLEEQLAREKTKYLAQAKKTKEDEATVKASFDLYAEQKRLALSEEYSNKILKAEGKIADDTARTQAARLAAQFDLALFDISASNDKFKKQFEERIDVIKKGLEEGTMAQADADRETDDLMDEATARLKDLTNTELADLEVEYALKEKLAEDNKDELIQIELEKQLAIKKIQAGSIAELESYADEVVEINEDAAEKSKDAFLTYLDGIDKVLGSTFSAIDDAIGREIDNLDKATQAQQKRVDEAKEIAEEGNAALLEAEEERLEKLTQAKEKAVRKQQALAVIELIANSMIAISKAAAQGGAAAPFTIAATIIALAAGLAAARATASQATFAEGGFTGPGYGQRDHTGELVAGTVHANEYVINKGQTSKYRGLLEAINQGRSIDALTPGGDGLVLQPLTGLEDRLGGIELAIKSQERLILNIDSRGFYGHLTKLGRKDSRIRNKAGL